MDLPILYSYRRCPYAMRARMALYHANIQMEIREISLRDKPAHMLQVSPKATVPVLVLADGEVMDESLAIMHWALAQMPESSWLNVPEDQIHALILENDSSFKAALDRYKYPDRYPESNVLDYRAQGEVFLAKLETLLNERDYLLSAHLSLVDVAIFPFIRQFSMVDSLWFESSPYPKLKAWLKARIESDLFEAIMQKTSVWVSGITQTEVN